LAVGIPLAVLGCQNEGRSDVSASSTAAAASGQSASGQSSARLDDATKTNILLRQIHAANQEEIDLGKLAQDKAQNADVKKFASDMVSDHSAADQKLTDLAKRINLDLNAAPRDPIEQALSAKSDECKRNLRSMSGAQFEVAYVAPQVDSHTLVLKMIDEGQKTASGDAKKLLEEIKPTVESHLEHSKSLQRGLVFSPAAVGGGPMGSESPGSAAPAAKHDGGRHDDMRDTRPKAGSKSNPNPTP